MTRRLLPLVATLLLIAAPAAAQTTIDAAIAVSEQGYYLGPGTGISESGVSDLVSEARNAGSRLSIVVLDSEPAGGATTFAGAVFDAVGGPGTVIVLTEDGRVGYETEGEFERSEVEAALDAADAAGGSDLTYLTNFVGALTGASAPTPASAPAPAPASSSSGGGGGGWLILLLVVGGFVAIVWFVMRRSRKSTDRRREGDIRSARAEIQKQLDSMANDILDLADRVRLGSTQAQQYFAAGSDVYEKASEEFAAATTLPQLEALAGRIDEAAWQLDASQAILDGEPVPPKPEKEMARCFFDPTHRGPMVEAVIETSAGTRQVRVCKPDADKLAAGQRPDSRMIDVGGRRVPAPRAPKSHGGGGFGGMDLLSILVGGASQALPDFLGRSRRGSSRRSGGGLFGASRRSSAPSSGGSSRSGPIPGPSTRRTTTRSSTPPAQPKRSRGGRRRKP